MKKSIEEIRKLERQYFELKQKIDVSKRAVVEFQGWQRISDGYDVAYRKRGEILGLNDAYRRELNNW